MNVKAIAEIQCSKSGAKEKREVTIVGYVTNHFGQAKAICIVDELIYDVHLDEIMRARVCYD